MQTVTEILSYHEKPVHYLSTFRDRSIRNAETSSSIILDEINFHSPSILSVTKNSSYICGYWFYLGFCWYFL